MKEELIRFGVSMDASLLSKLDQLAVARNCTRSELLRNLARTEVARASMAQTTAAYAAVTFVYFYCVREPRERLTALLNDLSDRPSSSLHVQLDRERSLAAIVLHGSSDQLKRVANQILGIRGVIQGCIELVAEAADSVSPCPASLAPDCGPT